MIRISDKVAEGDIRAGCTYASCMREIFLDNKINIYFYRSMFGPF